MGLIFFISKLGFFKCKLSFVYFYCLKLSYWYNCNENIVDKVYLYGLLEL